VVERKKTILGEVGEDFVSVLHTYRELLGYFVCVSLSAHIFNNTHFCGRGKGRKVNRYSDDSEIAIH